MIKVRGHSDDIICLDGDISDEIYPKDDESPTAIAFSDGTVLSVVYTNEGMWRISKLSSGTAGYNKTEPALDSNDYSDVVELDGDIQWAVAGELVK